jgi:hypothetical protein
MGGGQRSVQIEFDEHMLDVATHQVTRESSNAQRGYTVRA